jgi:hypothetical protein
MKTTVDLPLPLIKKAKKYAYDRNMTLKNVIEMGLQEILSKKNSNEVKFSLKNCSIEGQGLQAQLEWSDMHSLVLSSYEGRGGK